MLILFILLASLGSVLVCPIDAITIDDFPVGLHLDYTYTNADTTCGFHYDISGWTESPYNSSEYVLEIPYSVTGDCLNYEDVYLVFMPSWEIYAPGTGSAMMQPLFTNTSGWYAGMDLQDSPVAIFCTQTEIHVEGRSTISLSFGSLECWCVKAFTDYPSPTNSSFFFDIE